MNTNFSTNLYHKIINNDVNRKIYNFAASQYKDVDIYIVGGYIRDLILGIDTYDCDYVLCGVSAIEFAENLAKEMGGYFVLLDELHNIARVVLDDKKTTLDFSLCDGETILEDLNRRDITLNAMAYKLDPNKDSGLLDPHNGLRDLNNKLVKFVSEKNVIDDPLRILRLPRIAAHLSAQTDGNSIELMIKHYKLLDNVASERIGTELNKLLNCPNSYEYLKILVETGILEFIIPEMKDLRKVTPNVYHHLGLFDHTMEVYKQLEVLLLELKEETLEHLHSYINPSCCRIVALKLAALFHDIAKPQTWQITDDGKHTFIDHPAQGAPIAFDIVKRLKFPKNVAKIVENLVKYHLYPSQLSQNMEEPTEKAQNRFYRKLDTETPDCIILAIADRKSALGELITDDILDKSVDILFNLLENYYKYLIVEKSLPKLLNGNDIMKLLNIKPSPKLGDIIDELHEKQALGQITTVEEAKNWLLTTY